MDAMARKGRFAVLVLLAVLVVAGCTSGTGDKVVGEPVVLKMADGYQDLTLEPAVAYFVKQVDELSKGNVRIDVVDGWGNYQPDFEQRIAQDVRGGTADLGWVGTRIFDTLGVKSFQALTAPMLIDNYPLERAVIASDIPAEMLKGLSKLRVTGLAVLADGLRKPIAAERPLLGPADWRGISFNVFRSSGEMAAIRALGAVPTDVRAGDVAYQGLEKNLHIYQKGYVARFPYVTANVNLWPQTVALLANPGSLLRLNEEQRGWLRSAAHDAATRSTSLFDRDDAEIVAATCPQGARSANASEADLAALQQAFDPVYASLEQDPQTKAFIEQIDALKRSTASGPPLAIPADCTGSTAPPPAADPLAGTWQTGHITESQWVQAFVAGGGSEQEGRSSFAQSLGGGSRRYAVITLTFQDGSWVELESADGRPSEHGSDGSYTLADDGRLTSTEGSCVSTYRYYVSGGTLRLHVVSNCVGNHDAPYNATLFASFPLTKVETTIPDGVYRTNVSEKELLAAGVGSPEAVGNGGIQTLTISGGSWRLNVNDIPPDDCGSLSYSGQRVSFIGGCQGNAGQVEFSARWSSGNGELRFTDFQPVGDPLPGALYGTKPWKKIG